MNTHEEMLTRGVENIIPNKEKLRELLATGKKLNIYLGIDPTATRIHIGHAVPLRKLQAFSELGHHVTFLIGDFTALIGDTSDKDTERPVLTSEQITENFETYKRQAEKVIDFSKVSVRFNSEWLSKLSFAEIVKLCQHFSTGDFVGRELIKRRLTEGKKVGLHELLYPVMQGYDSYFMDTDIQLGGTDQTFNMQAGRTLQKDLRDKDSFIIANGFLAGTDGRKMSKSWGNAIWLTDEPDDMYGKVMSLKDDLIIEYFTLATKVSLEEIDAIRRQLEAGENPMTAKKKLAFQIVSELHSEEAAQTAQDHFEKTVQNKEIPEDIQSIDIPRSEASSLNVRALVVQAHKQQVSNSEAQRLIAQKAVRMNDRVMEDPYELVDLKDGDILKVGKRGYFRISLDNSDSQ